MKHFHVVTHSNQLSKVSGERLVRVISEQYDGNVRAEVRDDHHICIWGNTKAVLERASNFALGFVANFDPGIAEDESFIICTPGDPRVWCAQHWEEYQFDYDLSSIADNQVLIWPINDQNKEDLINTLRENEIIVSV